MGSRRRHQRPVGWRALVTGLLCLVFTGFMTLNPSVSLAAGEDNQAKILFDNGRVLYREGQYADAIAAWERAYALSNRPLILFNMANAYERNGQIREAIETLNRYRAFAEPQEREVLLRRIRNLESRLAFEPALGPVPQAASSSKTLPVLEISLVGVGLVGLTSGAVLGSSARNYGTKAEAFCGGSHQPCKSPAAPLLEKEKSLSVGADISFALGTAAIAGGVTLWVLRAARSNKSGDISVAPTPEGMVVHGRF